MMRSPIMLAGLTLLCGLILAVLPTGYAWNMTGHRVVAQIAYERLTPQAKARVDEISKGFSTVEKHPQSFVQGASWPDAIKWQDISAFSAWHYIDWHITDHKKNSLRPVKEQNVIWAIKESERVLSSKRSSLYQKTLFLRFLSHFVGDVHQPLHCGSYYGKRWPHGDRGGNLYPIKAEGADNLHSYWDSGLGLLPTKAFKHRKTVKKLAHKITSDYPEKSFSALLAKDNPQDWAKESYRINQDLARTVAPGAAPSEDYKLQAKSVLKQQLALAGYRLANMLNRLFG